MAAATPPVVSSRLGEQAAMEWSCILEVFLFYSYLSPCWTLKQLENGEYVMDNASIQPI